MAELADAPDFGCVTIVEFLLRLSGRVKIGGKINMRPWRNWQTRRIWVGLLQWSFVAAVGQGKIRRKIKYAPVAELADAPDLGSATTVEFL